MSKDPTFPFYSQDFLVGTFCMEDAAVGKYIRLLALQHQTGHIPEKIFLKICGGEADPEVLEKFSKDENGLYFNERLDEVLDTRERFKAKQSNNANQRWNKEDAKEIPEPCQTYTKSIPLENESEKEKEKEVKIEKVPFEIFWNLYDKKIDRKKCEPKWNRLTKAAQEDCIAKLPVYINATPNKKYRRDPETYLNNQSWENEVIGHSNTGPARQLSAAELILNEHNNGK